MRLVTYQALASRAVGVDDPGPEESRLIRVHVQHLRSKLGDSASNPVFIANVRGLGYKFMVPVTSHAASEEA
jgi:DNA-binding response OmpR family regulator